MGWGCAFGTLMLWCTVVRVIFLLLFWLHEHELELCKREQTSTRHVCQPADWISFAEHFYIILCEIQGWVSMLSFDRQWRDVLGSLTGGADYRFTLTIVLSWLTVDNSNYFMKARYKKASSSNFEWKKVVYKTTINFFYVNMNKTF